MSDVVTKSVCGVVMPISTIDGCSESHWTDVFDIVTEAIEDAGLSLQIKVPSPQVSSMFAGLDQFLAQLTKKK